MVGADQKVLAVIKLPALIINSACPATTTSGRFQNSDRYVVLDQLYGGGETGPTSADYDDSFIHTFG